MTAATFLLIYSLISGAGLTLLWLAFRLSRLQSHTHFGLNRAMLTAILLLSLTLPAIAFLRPVNKTAPQPVEATAELGPAIATAGGDAATAHSSASQALDPQRILDAASKVYLAGLAATAAWLLLGLGNVVGAIACGRRRRIDSRTTLVILRRAITPFTWGRWIVISEHDLNESATVVLDHEMAHRRAAHWADLLLARVASCINWYWPTAWLLTRNLAATHEYEADRRVLASGFPAASYQMMLINRHSTVHFPTLANPFNYHSLKNRITMMQKKSSPARSRMRALALLPAAALVIYLSALPALASAVNSTRPDEPAKAPAKKVYITPAGKTKATVSEKPVSKQSVAFKVVDDPVQPAAKVTKTTTTATTAAADTTKIFTEVEVMPQFKGGTGNLYQFISKTIRYPEEAARKDIQGRVIVQFVVNADGSVGEARVVRGVDPLLDAEALRVVSNLPDFIPGTMSGKPVRVWYTMPLTFRLSGGNDNKAKTDSIAN